MMSNVKVNCPVSNCNFLANGNIFKVEKNKMDIDYHSNYKQNTKFLIMISFPNLKMPINAMGVPMAIKYAAMWSKGLILYDYPAKYPLIQETRIEAVGKLVEKGRDHVVRGIQKESKEIVLWEELKEIGCPVLVLKGGTKGSLLNTDEADKYKNNLKNVELIEFSESGHDLWTPDYNKFINTITNYLNKIDN